MEPIHLEPPAPVAPVLRTLLNLGLGVYALFAGIALAEFDRRNLVLVVAAVVFFVLSALPGVSLLRRH